MTAVTLDVLDAAIDRVDVPSHVCFPIAEPKNVIAQALSEGPGGSAEHCAEHVLDALKRAGYFLIHVGSPIIEKGDRCDHDRI